ncbi:guanitoxin biosynthesis heme-dependent pre-guanitoxin N-hydroxylase GntA [Lysobacter sp. A3-1-A15]|uniref:guanitoxin biosynthesis heme-dependent pre-guanitoxin N-hydroxylase GntA n=1 Tax=Novilysobacter viscosus TaxID=3098602 RepID=UPI002EDA8F76
MSPPLAHVPSPDRIETPPEGTDPGEAFIRHVESPEFPCVGSKAALAQDAIRTIQLAPLGQRSNDAPLLDGLAKFSRRLAAQPADSRVVHSFVAIFDGPTDTDEARFEALLWSQLQRLHLLDVRRGHAWADGVSRDPDSPQFSLSLAGHPFFVIGLHPGASRVARRFDWPVMVFNSHVQFDRLREDGRYAKMQKATRARDLDLQGSINPNLADFGVEAETRQYSGREVEADWKCPFNPVNASRNPGGPRD